MQQPNAPKEYPFLTGIVIALMTLSLALVVLATWSFFHADVSKKPEPDTAKNKTAVHPPGRDYNNLPTASVSDQQTASNPDAPHTFSRLREEVDNLLLNQNNIQDSVTAALAGKLLIMNNVNRELEAENIRLREQLNKQGALPPGTESNGLQLLRPDDLPKLSVDEVQLAAYSAKNNVEMETGLATETEKIGGSFRISNAGSRQSVAEIAVVVVLPDGTVLKNPGAEGGIFYSGQTRRECSGKLRVTQNAGESRRINFSFPAPRFGTGKYLLEIYQNGILIGRSVKTLL